MPLFDMINKIGLDVTRISGWGNFLLLLSIVIQIAPIKLDPWGKVLTAIRGSFRNEIKEEIETQIKPIDEKVENLSSKIDRIKEEELANRQQDKALDARRRIIAFADEVVHGNVHSYEQWNSILEDITYYENYCEENPTFPNGKAISSIRLIKEVYNELLRTGGIK